MATTKKVGVKKEEPKYATVEQFNTLQGLLEKLVKGMSEEKDAVPAKPLSEAEQKEVTKAGPIQPPINPEWIEKAEEILGKYLDHCEVAYPRKGGVLFTLVIKKELSNANKDYLERYGTDRRTREIGNEGVEGVEIWCKLVKQNLIKPR